MKPFETLFLWIGSNFTTETYMFLTKIQGITWSIADIVLVFFLLKIAGLARLRTGKKGIRSRYLWLIFSAILTPVLIFTQSPKQFLALETIICGIQFSILIYTIIVDRKGFMVLIKEFMGTGFH